MGSGFILSESFDSFGLPLLEAVEPDDAIVHFPVKIKGSWHRSDEDIPYHITIRWGKGFDSEKLVQDVTDALKGVDLTPPHIVEFSPEILGKDPEKPFYVLRINCVPKNVLEIKKAIDPVFGPDDFPEFKMHITVDKDLWDEVKSRYLSPSDLQLEVGPLEICMGNKLLKSFDRKDEAKYQGREVSLNKPMRGDVKKYKVYVKDPETEKVKKVNFGDPDMEIKRDDPERRKSFRKRHKCDTAKDKTTARYWSCRFWSDEPVSQLLQDVDF